MIVESPLNTRIVVPHPGTGLIHRQIDLCEFIAIWICWQKDLNNADSEDKALESLMPEGKCNQAIIEILDLNETRTARRGLDLMLRILLGEKCYSTRWITEGFFKLNQKWLVAGKKIAGANGRTVNAVALTDEAIKHWRENFFANKNELLARSEALITSMHDSVYEKMAGESSGVETRDALSKGKIPQSILQQDFVLTGQLDRKNLIASVVESIQIEPFQAYYRRKCYGEPVQGWRERLHCYFWPKPEIGFAETNERLMGIVAQLQALLTQRNDFGWSSKLADEAVAIAAEIFRWGGVYAANREALTADNVKNVIESALLGARYNNAPMNSAWTKLAALVSMASNIGNHQAIWDSRVSHALIRRLDVCAGQQRVTQLFPNLGWVPGRGGSRKEPAAYQQRWPMGYQSWASHFEAAAVINEMVSVLNENLHVYGSPDVAGSHWTVRDVEMVLFMDGY